MIPLPVSRHIRSLPLTNTPYAPQPTLHLKIHRSVSCVGLLHTIRIEPSLALPLLLVVSNLLLHRQHSISK